MKQLFLKTALVSLVLMSVMSCGRKGGGGNIVGIGGTPYIYAELDSDGSNDSASAFVYVIDDSTGFGITYADVRIQGVVFNYYPQDQAYEGTLTVAPGDSVTLNVTVAGTSYAVTSNQFTAYPTIATPSAGAIWPVACTNTIIWSGGTPTDNAVLGFALIDTASGVVVWPADGFLDMLPISRTSYAIPGNSLQPGDRTAIVEIAKFEAIPAAAPGSEFAIGGFNSATVTIADAYLPLVSLTLSPLMPHIERGGSTQFTATGWYCDGSNQDLTKTAVWDSTDTAVATISNQSTSIGFATAVSGGTTTITAASGNIVGSTILEVYPYSTFPIDSWPEAVAIGDVTGDGKNDVVVVSSYDKYKLYLFAQNGSGGLVSAGSFSTTGSYSFRPYSVAIGDINNDGKNEVIVSNAAQNMEVFEQDGSGGLVSAATYTLLGSSLVKVADLNHDGRLDVVNLGGGSNKIAVFLQNAGGTLDAPVLYDVNHAGWDDLEVGDVNNDGWADIIVMSGQGLDPQIGVLTQKADGTFNAAAYYSPAGVSIGVGDVNGDGKNDVVVAANGACVFDQNNAGTLDSPVCYPTAAGSGALEVGDVNGDGRQDVVLVHNGWMGLGIFLQDAAGSLSQENVSPNPYGVNNPQSLAIGDINNDGLNDIVTLDTYKGLVVRYQN